MINTYFISDIHAGHKNILSYDNRPFKDVGTMDEEIIKRWNKKVNPDDEVWILGDISWYGPEQTVEFYKKLNGRKRLCIGNHDGKLIRDERVRALFGEIVPYKEIPCPGNKDKGIVLCHYPIPCFNKHFYGWYHLYGHVHITFEYNMMEHVKNEMVSLYDKPCNMYNVGCMLPYMDYTPQTLDTIVKANERAGVNLK